MCICTYLRFRVGGTSCLVLEVYLWAKAARLASLHEDRRLSKSRAHDRSTSLVGQLPKGGFPDTVLLVIGDLMLDRYVVGNVDRISPEAPVPVVKVTRERATAGGAGNVALNLANLGVRTLVAGAIGDDAAGKALLRILVDRQIDVSAVVHVPERPTTCKTRVMSGNHQIVRLDEEQTDDLTEAVSHALIERVSTLLAHGVQGVIISDYAKGTLTSIVLRQVIAECSQRGLPVLVDPKRSDYSVYAQATCLTPNVKEFHAAAAAMGIPHPDIASGGGAMRERLRCPMLLVTQGAQGMTLVLEEGTHHFPALAEEVFDVSGAGDTVIATFATGITAGLPAHIAAELANIAASQVVRKVGTAPVIWDELIAASASA